MYSQEAVLPKPGDTASWLGNFM